MAFKQGLKTWAPIVAALLCAAPLAHARGTQQEYDEAQRAMDSTPQTVVNAMGTERSPERLRGRGGARPMAIPDIFGPGAVLNVGNVHMKVTNFGLFGNPFTNLSTDPSGQWPAASGTEYLAFGLFSVGGVNPSASDPNAVRRVSYYSEWRPPTIDPEDRMYRAYDGIINGNRNVDDDGDDRDVFDDQNLVDEDFLDGRDNDGDGRIDEDYGAYGQQMYSCVIRDDTQAAINTVFNEKHVPLGLEVRQLAWAYSVSGLTDFDPIQYVCFNRSGHTIDSMYFGIRIDMDCGPSNVSNYWTDDFDAPYIPNGKFVVPLDPNIDDRAQWIENQDGTVDSICTRFEMRVDGFSVVDDDGDEGRTQGVASCLLLGHTTDPLGMTAPAKKRFRAFRSYIGGTPYSSNGNPTIDQERFEFMSSEQNIGADTTISGTIPGDQKGDYQAWFSVGPFLNVPSGGQVEMTIAFAVQRGNYQTTLDYPTDIARFHNGTMQSIDLFEKYPVLRNAYAAQLAYEGKYGAPRPSFVDRVPNCYGCETGLKLPRGTPPTSMTVRCPGEEGTTTKTVNDFEFTWFDFDCDPCTGSYKPEAGGGKYLTRWVAESPPPNPNLNLAASHNYSDNPNRVVAGTDNAVVLAWDNLSETTADPKSGRFDFESYRIWKVAGWRRPVGSAGPNDEDWALIADFKIFKEESNRIWVKDLSTPDPEDSIQVCPTLFVPQTRESLVVCLNRGDFYDEQSGQILRPDTTLDCVRDTLGLCIQDIGVDFDGTPTMRTRYPIGRYKYVDREVKNGFVYFYSVTASDEDGQSGRRSAVESEGVSPQISAKTTQGVWVVPNPYRGYANINLRSSSWDLTPNATDPTGTHIDFMGLPAGGWTIRVYTVSGDLVAVLNANDPVNDSVRGPVSGDDGVVRPGFNRQQDSPNDGQARWNLISRNGQDIVSGIYLFVVDSQQGQQRGKFVVIR